MQNTEVHYTPGNCALLIGPSDVLIKRLEMVRVAGLRPALLCSDLPDAGALPRGLRALPGQLADFSGWMGRFSARMQTRSGPVELTPLSFHEDGHFDWLLDFSATPQARTAVPPLGYYALAADDFPELKRVLLEIVGRVRTGFVKPRYFSFDAELCAHTRQGVEGCTACLSACAAGAISSEKARVRIEPKLCQGCGACALVCPSGAVRYADPAPSVSLTRLLSSVAPWHEAGRDATGLWIATETTMTELPPGWLGYPVAEPASLGLEFWLAALASGCNRVAIAAGGIPLEVRRGLDEQIAVAQNLLSALGLPVSVGLAENSAELDALPAMPPHPPVKLIISDDKRTLLHAALDALIRRTQTPPISIPLATGPLGEVRIAAAKCTLCAACVRICPSGALLLSSTSLQLHFTEERCVQCGLCASVCPEKVVTLAPRLLTSRTARTTPRRVMAAEPFACAECGVPFASRAMIQRTRTMMLDHPMFQGERSRLMNLCPDCRQKALAGVPVSDRE